MKEHAENRNGRVVTIVEREPKDLTPEERQALLEARVAALEAEVADLKKRGGIK